MPQLGLDLELEVLLDILDKTTREYMEAFEIDSHDIDLSCDILKKYQAFEKIVAFYMNGKDECISFVIFNFDWNKYELVYQSDDPDIILNRKSILTLTPKQILEDACKVIKERIKKIKDSRSFSYIKMVYYYSDKVWQNKELLEKIRRELNLVPFDKNSIVYSEKMKGYKTTIDSSITENTLSIDFMA